MSRMTNDKNHIDEALRFEAIIIDSSGYRSDGFYSRTKSHFATVKKYIEKASKLEAGADMRIKASAAFKSQADYDRKLSAAVGNGADFAESFNALMIAIFEPLEIPAHKYGAEIFERTGISDKVFRDMRKGTKLPSHRTIVALCAGLDLEISTAEKLLALCGKAFSQTDEHSAFRLILTAYRGVNITERNDILETMGFGRLTDDK